MKTPISILVLVLTLLNITHALQARGDPPLLEPPIDAPAGPGNPTNRFKLDLSEPIKEVTAHGKCRRDRKLPEGWCYIRNDSKHNNHLYLVFKNGFTAYGPSCLRDSRCKKSGNPCSVKISIPVRYDVARKAVCG